MKILIFILLFGFDIYSFANDNTQVIRFDQFQFKTGVKFDYVEGDDIKARVFGYQFDLILDQQLDEFWKMFFHAQAELEVGSNEVVGLVNEFEPDQGIHLLSGGIEYELRDRLLVQMGALKQEDYNSPLLITDTAFASLREVVYFGSFYFMAQQSIPNNSKLSKRIGDTETGTPYFGMETFGFSLSKPFELTIELSQFNYNDLASNIAESSKTLGNTVTGVGEANRFVYDYTGQNLVIDLIYRSDSIHYHLWGQYIYNDGAPDKSNEGQLLQLGLGIAKNSIYIESFRNESDTSPAYYNSKSYGHNNMEGNGIIYRYEFEGIRANLRYAHLSPIEDNGLQSKMSLLTMSLNKTF